jgi:hypothetical protein
LDWIARNKGCCVGAAADDDDAAGGADDAVGARNDDDDDAMLSPSAALLALVRLLFAGGSPDAPGDSRSGTEEVRSRLREEAGLALLLVLGSAPPLDRFTGTGMQVCSPCRQLTRVVALKFDEALLFYCGSVSDATQTQCVSGRELAANSLR